jgi:hypothetical protein
VGEEECCENALLGETVTEGGQWGLTKPAEARPEREKLA